MGERSIYELPWWERNDISTYDNFALDDEELKSVRKQLEDQQHLLDRDFQTIEDEVRSQMAQTGLIDNGEVIDLEEHRLSLIHI